MNFLLMKVSEVKAHSLIIPKGVCKFWREVKVIVAPNREFLD